MHKVKEKKANSKDGTYWGPQMCVFVCWVEVGHVTTAFSNWKTVIHWFSVSTCVAFKRFFWFSVTIKNAQHSNMYIFIVKLLQHFEVQNKTIRPN